MFELLLVAALINWIVTTIFVEAHLFDKPRNWVIDHTNYVWFRGELHPTGRHKHGIGFVMPEDTTAEEAAEAEKHQVHAGPWLKLAQLITCHLCTGVWVGFAEAAYFGGPDHGWARLIANGLLYAAGGHLIFEARSKIALVEKTDAH